MRCIRCNTDNRLRERRGNGGRCKQCRHPFVFGATGYPPISRLTDVFFQRAIASVSANNTLLFTRTQFFYHLNRRLPVRSPFTLRPSRTALPTQPDTSGIFWGLVLLAVGVFGLFTLNWSIVILGVGGVLLLYNEIQRTIEAARTRREQANLPPPPPPPPGYPPRVLAVTPAQVDGFIRQWEAVNGRIPGLLTVPTSQTVPREVNPELTAYSFDRALVCDSDAIAQFLVANNFHFERNCAVLSGTGYYPPHIFDTVMAMLRRNPNLRVYALHDASVTGVDLAHRLHTSPDWFADSSIEIYDLGVLPRQVFRNRNVFVRKASVLPSLPLSDAARQLLTADELRWLEAGQFVELESFPPQTLLQIAMQGVVRTQQPDATDEFVPAGAAGGEFILLASDSDSFG